MHKIINRRIDSTPRVKKYFSTIQELNDKNGELGIENFKLRREIEDQKKTIFQLNQKHYKYLLSNLKDKIKKSQKIRVCFFVMFDSVFPTETLFKIMLTDPIFDPFIIVIPDISRGDNHLKLSFNNTYKSLSNKYKKVYKGYNIKLNRVSRIIKKADIICFSSPYENMSLKNYEIKHYINKNVLTFYVNYAYPLLKYTRTVTMLDSYSLFWKVFVENKLNIEELKKYQHIKGKNAVVSGYCKMDDLYNQKFKKRKRKAIIIAPHHTVTSWKLLKISNFLKYSTFFLKLPELYPEIDFIFRPHPLLITQLKKSEIWGEEKTQEYFDKMESHPNVIYSKGGNYFDIFANSDGIIHDCGSFLAEYFFTEKPACYLLKNKKTIAKWFLPIGKKCLNFCYQAYQEKDIISFIEDIIIKDKDTKKEDRQKFVNSTLKVNYPNSSRYILNYIKKQIQ